MFQISLTKHLCILPLLSAYSTLRKSTNSKKKKEKKKDDIIWKKKFQLSGACYLVRRVCRTLLLFLVLEMSDICRSLYWWQLSNIEHLEESLRRASNIHIKGKLALFYELISSNFFFSFFFFGSSLLPSTDLSAITVFCVVNLKSKKKCTKSGIGIFLFVCFFFLFLFFFLCLLLFCFFTRKVMDQVNREPGTN